MQTELAEEHARERIIVVLAGMDKNLCVGGTQGTGNGGCLHELRARAHYREHPHRVQCTVKPCSELGGTRIFLRREQSRSDSLEGTTLPTQRGENVSVGHCRLPALGTFGG